MEKTNKTRITKAMRFEDIKAMLNGQPVTYGTTTEDAMDFIEYEVALLAKKNSGENKKQTKTQQENESLKEQIMEYLAGLPEDTDGVTCTDIFKSVPSLAAFSTQKAAALVRMLKLDGRVTCQEKKGKSLFKMA